MLALAKQEIAAGQPAKGVICAALMNGERPDEENASHIKRALEWLTENEPAASCGRIIKSLQAYLNPNADTLNAAAGCYINANSIELNIAKFTAHDFRGARLKNASLDYLAFNNMDLSGACLDHASLSGIDMDGCNLSGASLVHANFSLSIFINNNFSGADFSDADFSYADLTRANLKNAVFDNATFDNTEFIVSNKFYDPLAFEAELDRLHTMLALHRNEIRLRSAIAQNIINFTRKPEVDIATAISILKSALAHTFSQQHQPIDVIKTGSNFLVSYAQAAFFKTNLPPLPIIESNEEKLLKPELQKLEARLAAALVSDATAATVRPA